MILNLDFKVNSDNPQIWLQRNGVNTIGAATKVMKFDRLGKRVRPGTVGRLKVGQREYPKCPSVKNH